MLLESSDCSKQKHKCICQDSEAAAWGTCGIVGYYILSSTDKSSVLSGTSLHVQETCPFMQQVVWSKPCSACSTSSFTTTSATSSAVYSTVYMYLSDLMRWCESKAIAQSLQLYLNNQVSFPVICILILVQPTLFWTPPFGLLTIHCLDAPSRSRN